MVNRKLWCFENFLKVNFLSLQNWLKVLSSIPVDLTNVCSTLTLICGLRQILTKPFAADAHADANLPLYRYKKMILYTLKMFLIAIIM